MAHHIHIFVLSTVKPVKTTTCTRNHFLLVILHRFDCMCTQDSCYSPPGRGAINISRSAMNSSSAVMFWDPNSFLSGHTSLQQANQLFTDQEKLTLLAVNSAFYWGDSCINLLSVSSAFDQGDVCRDHLDKNHYWQPKGWFYSLWINYTLTKSLVSKFYGCQLGYHLRSFKLHKICIKSTRATPFITPGYWFISDL